MFFILAAPGMYAAPQTQETDKKALREQRREERRQKREERREERQQRKKEQKTPQSPVSVPPTNPAPETIHEEIETPREPVIISKQKRNETATYSDQRSNAFYISENHTIIQTSRISNCARA